MNKKQVQNRVLKNGVPIPLDDFTWDEATSTFSPVGAEFMDSVDWLIMDIPSCCRIDCGRGCRIDCGGSCIVDCESSCVINCGYNCTLYCLATCTISCGYGCTINCLDACKITSGESCVILDRHDSSKLNIIQPAAGDLIEICPYGVPGHLVNGEFNGVPHMIRDNILSRVVSKKGNVYKVVNHGETEESWLIVDGDDSAHGRTLKEAQESLVFKGLRSQNINISLCP